MVAPNSPNARARAQTVPATNPRAARGRVTVQNTRAGPAPKVRATASSRGLISSKARRTVRTKKGKDITAMAATTARQVKTISVPKRCWASNPKGP